MTETSRAMWDRSSRSVATWNMMSAEGQVIGNGFHSAEYDDHGRLAAMTGFFAR
jgi:hypothetical protein